MVELHGERVLEKIEIPGLRCAEARGDDGAVHERPGVEPEAAIDAGNQRPGQELYIDEQQDEPGNDRRGLGSGGPAMHPSQIQDQPKRVAEDRDGDPEMGRQAILADIHPVHEAAHDHVPAQCALQSAEDEKPEETRQHGSWDIAGEPKPHEWHEKDDADETAQKAMGPFPPIDPLEAFQVHALVHLRIFRNLFVGVECLLPMRVR
ncbi:hypothetical protein AUC68_12950 [Methyloceanibacter methanicus]|uniref:Uncharacterized protein n=1 Tax=Methyloceanibacter methanicus TaxID=1774968 RepID=A0A1E3W4W6_9HYPH|nr:hypothetical protein AUC68_12950 [Methyloceanibacter methanicus]